MNCGSKSRRGMGALTPQNRRRTDPTGPTNPRPSQGATPFCMSCWHMRYIVQKICQERSVKANFDHPSNKLPAWMGSGESWKIRHLQRTKPFQISTAGCIKPTACQLCRLNFIEVQCTCTHLGVHQIRNHFDRSAVSERFQ